MPKAEWGKKIVCTNCEAKFYDLNRKPIICPKCGTEYSDMNLDVKEVNTKQVFGGNVDTVTDDNLVGSDASESIAEIEDLEIDDSLDDETISLEDAEPDVDIGSDVGNIDLNEKSSEDLDEN